MMISNLRRLTMGTKTIIETKTEIESLSVVILHGSSRKNQNSDTLATHCLEGIAEKHQITPKYFYLNEMSIRPYQGCLYCNTHPTHDCAIKDDMQSIYSAYKQASSFGMGATSGFCGNVFPRSNPNVRNPGI